MGAVVVPLAVDLAPIHVSADILQNMRLKDAVARINLLDPQAATQIFKVQPWKTVFGLHCKMQQLCVPWHINVEYGPKTKVPIPLAEVETKCGFPPIREVQKPMGKNRCKDSSLESDPSYHIDVLWEAHLLGTCAQCNISSPEFLCSFWAATLCARFHE